MGEVGAFAAAVESDDAHASAAPAELAPVVASEAAPTPAPAPIANELARVEPDVSTSAGFAEAVPGFGALPDMQVAAGSIQSLSVLQMELPALPTPDASGLSWCADSSLVAGALALKDPASIDGDADSDGDADMRSTTSIVTKATTTAGELPSPDALIKGGEEVNSSEYRAEYMAFCRECKTAAW